MQRHRNYQHFRGRLGGQPADRRRKHRAEPASGWVQAAVFERVNRIPHPSFVWPVRYGAHKSGRR
jgi:hypothetical protein